MKVVIFEGCDNVGKSLIVNDLCKKIDALTESQAYVRCVHCTAPEGKTDKEKWQFQQKHFTELVDEAVSDAKSGEFDYVIFDRFIEGEYVWGTLYRGESKEEVKGFISELEKKLISGVGEDNVLYVQLAATPEWVASVDDGRSFSDEVESKARELNLFNEIYDAALYKHKNSVEVARNGCWRPELHVLNDALNGFM